MSQLDQTAAMSDEFLLATKLARPPIRSDVIARPRLVEKLRGALHGPLTLLTAAAGFGKTTLLSATLEQDRWPTAWVSLDSGDNDLVLFWIYVFAALEGVQPGVSKAARPLLQTPRPASIEAVLTTLINALMALEQDIILVLDDYHSITASATHAALAFFLEHLPPRLHVVIATRIDPLLPLARWRARGQLTELRSSDLRFSVEETAAFFQQAPGLRLSAEQLQAVDTRVEGWIAGLQLAALSMRGREDISAFITAFTGSHRYIVDYLIQEVFALQTQDIQTFLLRTAILERLCASLCEAVTGQSDGQAMLERLEQANLFLQPLDDERCWYRYHHLFAELLRDRLQHERPELVAALHRQASLWYEQHALLPEAISHALNASDFQRAAQLIEAVGDTLTRRGEFIIISSWLDQFPAEEIQSRPALAILRSWLLFLTGEYAAAERQLQEIEQRYNLNAIPRTFENLASAPQEMQPALKLVGQVAAVRASIAIIQEDAERTIAFARQALNYLSEEDMITGLVTWFLGMAYWLSGDLEAGSRALGEAAAMSLAHGNLYMAFMATNELAFVQVLQGYLHQAEQTYLRAMRVAEQPGGATVVLGPINVGLASLQYEWNHLEEAERLLQQGIAQCLHMENDRTALDGCILLARVRQVRGDQEGVQELLEKIGRLASKPSIPPSQTHLLATFRAWLALRQGEQAAAVRWAQQCGLHADDEINPRRANEYLMLARVLIAQEKFTEAFTCLRQLSRMAQACGRVKNSIEVLILEALAHQAQGNTEAARERLENALLLAEMEGYIRLFVDEGKPLASILKVIHTQLQERQHPAARKPDHRRPSLRYVEKLRAAFHEEELLAGGASPQAVPSSSDGIASALLEPLSARELEVLRLIAAGCSNRDIADRLVLAVSTVKWYVNSIYGKLHVESRTQAVARARELRLL